MIKCGNREVIQANIHGACLFQALLVPFLSYRQPSPSDWKAVFLHGKFLGVWKLLLYDPAYAYFGVI